MTRESNALMVAYVAGAHGIKGEVKLHLLATSPSLLADYPLFRDAALKQPVKLDLHGQVGKHLIARIAGIADRNAAEAVKGMQLFIHAAALPEKDEDEFYIEELKGMKVQLQTGEMIATVHEVHNFGAGDILELRYLDSQRLEMFSFTLANFPEIDAEKGIILFCPPEEEVTEEPSSSPTPSGKGKGAGDE